MFADILFNEGINVSIRTDSSGNFTDSDRFFGVFHAVDIAFDFSHPVAQFETKRRRFSMDAMSTTDAGRIFKFNGTAAEYGVEVFKILDKDVRRLFQHRTQSRILTSVDVRPRCTYFPASPMFSERLETKAAIS